MALSRARRKIRPEQVCRYRWCSDLRDADSGLRFMRPRIHPLSLISGRPRSGSACLAGTRSLRNLPNPAEREKLPQQNAVVLAVLGVRNADAARQAVPRTIAVFHRFEDA